MTVKTSAKIGVKEIVKEHWCTKPNELGVAREIVLPATDGSWHNYITESHDTGMEGCERCITIRKADELTEKHALTELALKRNESLLRDFLDSTFEAIVGLDNAGLCTFINKSGIELLGYDTAAELVGKNMHAMYHHSNPDGSLLAEADCTQLRGLYAGKPVHNRDVVFWRKDGSPFPASCRFQPFHADAGPSGGVVTFLDISAQINNSE